MSISIEERAELDRLEAEFEAAGGRGVDVADRLDHLRAKASFPSVSDLIDYLGQIHAPDDTFVFLSTDDVEVPCNFISIDAFMEDFYLEVDDA